MCVFFSLKCVFVTLYVCIILLLNEINGDHTKETDSLVIINIEIFILYTTIEISIMRNVEDCTYDIIFGFFSYISARVCMLHFLKNVKVRNMDSHVCYKLKKLFSKIKHLL